jgi:hypothetical protein
VPGPLVSRERELTELRRWLAELDQGTGRLVLVTGEPGIRKTRLAREFVALALADGRRVAWGRAAEDAGAPPLWPWREVLRGLGTTLGPAPTDEDLEPHDRFLVAHELAHKMLAAAGNGLVIVLDDAHSADRASLLVLRHLADRIADAAVLLVVTFRNFGTPSALDETLPALVRAMGTERLGLRPLDEEGVRAQPAERRRRSQRSACGRGPRSQRREPLLRRPVGPCHPRGHLATR